MELIVWTAGRVQSRTIRTFISKEDCEELGFIGDPMVGGPHRTKFSVALDYGINKEKFMLVRIIRNAATKKIPNVCYLQKDGNRNHYQFTTSLPGLRLARGWKKSEFKAIYSNDTLKINLPTYFTVIPLGRSSPFGVGGGITPEIGDNDPKETQSTFDPSKERELINALRLGMDLREAEAITLLQGMSDEAKQVMINRLKQMGWL